MSKPRIRMVIGASTIFKLFLLTGVVAVSVVFIWYTYYVIGRLRADVEDKVSLYVRLWVRAIDQETPSSETQLIFDEIISRANFPIVVASSKREPNFWRNLEGIDDKDQSSETRARVKEIMLRMHQEHGEILISFGGVNSDSAVTGVGPAGVNYFYHGDPALIDDLEMAPYIQIAMIVSFLSIGFVGFTNIKRSEERHIWVGMAKETAHQLGTPISALMGWLEVMRSRAESGASDSGASTSGNATSITTDAEIFESIDADIQRLRQVANRFGKIGSEPEMKSADLNSHVQETVEYFKKRLPFGKEGIQIEFEKNDLPPVSLNVELMDWAIENLIKNSLEAVDSRSGVVKLKSSLGSAGNSVTLEVWDNGKGVPRGAHRRVFRPGFSSKNRGWGLGLTLCKRIVEDYHGGKLILAHSSPGDTLFTLTLPVAKS